MVGTVSKGKGGVLFKSIVKKNGQRGKVRLSKAEVAAYGGGGPRPLPKKNRPALPVKVQVGGTGVLMIGNVPLAKMPKAAKAALPNGTTAIHSATGEVWTKSTNKLGRAQWTRAGFGGGGFRRPKNYIPKSYRLPGMPDDMAADAYARAKFIKYYKGDTARMQRDAARRSKNTYSGAANIAKYQPGRSDWKGLDDGWGSLYGPISGAKASVQKRYAAGNAYLKPIRSELTAKEIAAIARRRK